MDKVISLVSLLIIIIEITVFIYIIYFFIQKTYNKKIIIFCILCFLFIFCMNIDYNLIKNQFFDFFQKTFNILFKNFFLFVFDYDYSFSSSGGLKNGVIESNNINEKDSNHNNTHLTRLHSNKSRTVAGKLLIRLPSSGSHTTSNISISHGNVITRLRCTFKNEEDEVLNSVSITHMRVPCIENHLHLNKKEIISEQNKVPLDSSVPLLEQLSEVVEEFPFETDKEMPIVSKDGAHYVSHCRLHNLCYPYMFLTGRYDLTHYINENFKYNFSPRLRIAPFNPELNDYSLPFIVNPDELKVYGVKSIQLLGKVLKIKGSNIDNLSITEILFIEELKSRFSFNENITYPQLIEYISTANVEELKNTLECDNKKFGRPEISFLLDKGGEIINSFESADFCSDSEKKNLVKAWNEISDKSQHCIKNRQDILLYRPSYPSLDEFFQDLIGEKNVVYLTSSKFDNERHILSISDAEIHEKFNPRKIKFISAASEFAAREEDNISNSIKKAMPSYDAIVKKNSSDLQSLNVEVNLELVENVKDIDELKRFLKSVEVVVSNEDDLNECIRLINMKNKGGKVIEIEDLKKLLQFTKEEKYMTFLHKYLNSSVGVENIGGSERSNIKKKYGEIINSSSNDSLRDFDPFVDTCKMVKDYFIKHK